MREILFRGKRADNGEWVEGDFAKPYNIVFCAMEDGEDAIANHKVISDTLGQFTGLNDKNGNKVFEGDIVKRTSYNAFGDEYDGFTGAVIFDCGTFYIDNNADGCLLWDDESELEIIGNIHDNYELIESAEDPAPAQKCRVCGCTDNHACEGGCYWVEDDLCSSCADPEE